MKSNGGLTFYDGNIRIVSASGDLVADGLDPALYPQYIGERVEPWSYLKSPARNLYGARPPAYVLTICGECFDVGECLSPAVAAHVPELKARVRGLVAEAVHACAAVYRLVLRLQ